MTANEELQAEIRSIASRIRRHLDGAVDEVAAGPVTALKIRRALNRIYSVDAYLRDMDRAIDRLDLGAGAVPSEVEAAATGTCGLDETPGDVVVDIGRFEPEGAA